MQPQFNPQQRHQPQGSIASYDQAPYTSQTSQVVPQQQMQPVDQFGQPVYNDQHRTSNVYAGSYIQPQAQQLQQPIQQNVQRVPTVVQPQRQTMTMPQRAPLETVPQAPSTQQWQQVPQQYAMPAPQQQYQQPVQYAPQAQMAAPIQTQPVYAQAPQPVAQQYQAPMAPVEQYEQVAPIISMPPQQQQQMAYDPYHEQQRMPLNQRPEEIVIEPSETDINASDLDEGLVMGAQTNQRRRQPAAHVVSPRRLNFNKQAVNPQEQFSPRVHVARQEYTAPHTRIQQEFQNKRQMIQQYDNNDYQHQQQLNEDPYAEVEPHQFMTQQERDQNDLSGDDWKTIQKRIDTEYEKKLKQVGDDALNKLKLFQAEHKALLEKTQYLIEQGTPVPPQQEVEDNQQPRNRVFQPARVEDLSILPPEKTWQKLSNVQNIRQFHKEYNEVINFGMNEAGELYLVDILKRLHLLPHGELLPTKDHERDLYHLIGNSKDNLLIRSDLEQENDQTAVQDLEGDLTRNLFQICCAILNLTVNQRGHNSLDERLLMSYLGSINYAGQGEEDTPTPGAPGSTLSEEHSLIPVPLHLKEQGQAAGFQYDESEMVVVSGYTVRDQLACIKSLINRPSYSLSDRHIRLVCDAFQNFADNRQRAYELQLQHQQQLDTSVRMNTVPQTPPQVYQQQLSQPSQPIAMSEQRQPINPVDLRYSAKGPHRGDFNADIEQQKTIDRQVMQSRAMSPIYANSEAQANKHGQRQMGQPVQQQQPLATAPPRQFQTAQKQPRYQPAQQPVPQQQPVQQRPIYAQQHPNQRQISPNIQVRNVDSRLAASERLPRQIQDVQQPKPRQVVRVPVQVNDIDDPLTPVDAFDQPRSSEAQQLSFGTSTRQRRKPASTLSEQPGRNHSVPRSSQPFQPVPTTVAPQQQAARRVRPDRSANAAQRQQLGAPAAHSYRANSGKPQAQKTRPRGQAGSQYDEEPICVLKVELDGGENVQHITVYEGEVAEQIVDEFGRKFNLSDNAKQRLLAQINAQIGN